MVAHKRQADTIASYMAYTVDAMNAAIELCKNIVHSILHWLQLVHDIWRYINVFWLIYLFVFSSRLEAHEHTKHHCNTSTKTKKKD